MSRFHDALIADLQLIASEIGRLNALLLDKGIDAIADDNVFAALPHPSGGSVSIGQAANDRIWDLAAMALKESAFAGRVEPEQVVNEVRRAISQLLYGGELSGPAIQKALAQAVKAAGRACRDRTHLLPAELMWLAEPIAFRLGPVDVLPTARLRAEYASALEAMIQSDIDEHRSEANARANAEEILTYYESFDWTLRVRILGCDRTTSRDRAEKAITAAVDLIRLLAGDSYSRRMRVGGLRAPDRNTAHLSLEGDVFSWSYARTPAGEVGFDGWLAQLEGPIQREVLAAAGACLEIHCDPRLEQPLASRWLDALSWFGQAVADPSHAAAIVKFITAVERLVMTRDTKPEGVLATFRTRAAALAFQPDDLALAAHQAEAAFVYAVRSDLVHGSMSPYAPDLPQARRRAAAFARRVLLHGLLAFQGFNLIDTKLSDKLYGQGLDNLAAKIALDGGEGLFGPAS